MNSLAVICGLALFAVVLASPFGDHRVRRQAGTIEEKLGLPSNATAIRNNIVDTFSCDGKIYGYYADVDNECQLFHICYPVELADGTKQTFKWSFICPEETIFNQESMTCTFPTDAIPCSEAASFYNLNQNFGVIPTTTVKA
ncbi:U-scoloptoxin(01)-Cw1a-like [Daphnia pulicaria]|uniref:U-scoloptoxin(01)-Cw1a-like n=1 Tax=Daphnia pulicaria TaxID=35523 RepID=UPI001EEA9EB7|nr:U-scoloptoxin(01)-Cw1a-like [Daphnia pulicaria]